MGPIRHRWQDGTEINLCKQGLQLWMRANNHYNPAHQSYPRIYNLNTAQTQNNNNKQLIHETYKDPYLNLLHCLCAQYTTQGSAMYLTFHKFESLTLIHATLTFWSQAVSLRTTRFNIQKFYVVLALRWVFCTDIRTDSDFCFVYH